MMARIKYIEGRTLLIQMSNNSFMVITTDTVKRVFLLATVTESMIGIPEHQTKLWPLQRRPQRLYRSEGTNHI